MNGEPFTEKGRRWCKKAAGGVRRLELVGQPAFLLHRRVQQGSRFQMLALDMKVVVIAHDHSALLACPSSQQVLCQLQSDSRSNDSKVECVGI